VTSAETSAPAARDRVPGGPGDEGSSVGAVFRNGAFLRLWLSQVLTQIGGNMVLFGLTVIVVDSVRSNTAVSLLILTFLGPAVLFSAVAGVYVDRIDRRLILVATNLIRAVAFIGLYLVGANFLLILVLNTFISIVNVFFAPAEAAMIPVVVPRKQLLAANGIFTLTLNAAFALGFALLGPLVVNIANPEAVILVVAALFFMATALCWTLPAAPPTPATAPAGIATEPAVLRATGVVAEGRQAVASTFAELREGLRFISGHREISWSLVYLGIAASLVGVLGVLGPDFAETTLELEAKDFAVVVLPLGFGIVMGILLLNVYGRYIPRRRVIEFGLMALGTLLAMLSIAGPISRFLQRADDVAGIVDLSAVTSLLAIVVFIAFLAGIAYACVAIPAQTQLQEDLPEDVRGRVFGVLNMLVSVSSFLPIILVGPISDLVGTTAVMLAVAIVITATGVASYTRRGPLKPAESGTVADPHAVDPIAAALGADRPTWHGPADEWPVATEVPVTMPIVPRRRATDVEEQAPEHATRGGATRVDEPKPPASYAGDEPDRD
jgi:MFS family permease